MDLTLQEILNDSDEDDEVLDCIDDCKKMGLYKQPSKISHEGKLNNSWCNTKQDLLPGLIGMVSLRFRQLYEVEILNVVTISSKMELMNQRDEIFENQTKFLKKCLAIEVFQMKPFFEVAINCMEISLADRRQCPAIAAQLLTEAFCTAEHLEPCCFTARLWQLKGFFLWRNLDKPAFCNNPLAEFNKIEIYYQQCYGHLRQDMNKGGLSTNTESAITLSCIVRIKLMLPAYMDNKHGKIAYYIRHYKPSWEQLQSASSTLKTLKKDAMELHRYTLQNLYSVLEIFLKIRLIDYLKHIGDEGGALKVLDQLWGILEAGHSHFCLHLFGLSETVPTLLEEREGDLKKSRIVAIQGPPALFQEKVNTETGSSFHEISNNSSSISSAD